MIMMRYGFSFSTGIPNILTLYCSIDMRDTVHFYSVDHTNLKILMTANKLNHER